MCTTCMALRPYDDTCPYRDAVQDGQTTGDGDATAGSTTVWSADQVATYLTTGYWGAGPLSFNVSVGGTLLVNLSGLNIYGRTLAEAALDAWSDITGIFFQETTSTAHITFDDNNPGAYAQFSYYGDGTIVSSFVNVSTSWIGTNDRIDSYGFQTYLHEIGHALGLGHAGPYNGGASYGADNLYANDSWQMSVMSYFDQAENTAVDASFAYVVTPMLADILAIQSLYGVAATRSGDTVYGLGGNSGTYLDTWTDLSAPTALTLLDSGGRDVIDLSHSAFAQRLDLRSEAVSDVLGLTGNLVIARDTVIEEARTGVGSDTVTGNAADNTLRLGDGNDTGDGQDGADTIFGEGGDDMLSGGAGDDTLDGGIAEDTLNGGDGNDTLLGGAGFDTLNGGAGDDTGFGGAQADSLYGGAGNDTFHGDEGRDRLFGDAGDDWLSGGADDDIIRGGTEEDTLLGGAGDDMLWGDGGFDLLRGGDGDDQMWGGNQADNLYGDAGNDLLYGDGGFDRLFGGAGDDTGHGGDGDDALFGDDGNDTLWGDAGNDRFFGGAGNDTLFGGDGNDTIRGNAGFDTIVGGAGNDNLGGNFNADTFVFADGHGSDTIVDFEALNVFEKIDLSGVTAITDFDDLSNNHLTQDGADAVITGAGGDQIRLTGVSITDLDDTDFLF